MRLVSRAAPIIVAVAALLYVGTSAYRVTSSPDLIARDIVQPYLMASAIRDHGDPYQPRSALTAKYLKQTVMIPEDNPPAYTPITGVLFVPFSYLSLGTFSAVWMVASSLFALLAIIFLCRDTIPKQKRVGASLLVWGVLILSFAGSDELRWGQFGFLLLLLVSLSNLCLKYDQGWMAGAVLGLCFSLKLLFLPLILYFALKKEVRIVLGFVCVVVGLACISLWCLGLGVHLRYAQQVLPTVQANWGTEPGNYSISAAILRFSSPPLVRAADKNNRAGRIPHLEQPLVRSNLILAANAIAILLLVWVLILALRDPTVEIALARLIPVSLIIPPVSWPHYAVLLLLPSVFYLHNFPASRMALFPACCAGLLLSVNFAEVTWASLSWTITAAGIFPLPLHAAMLSAIPLLLYLFIVFFPVKMHRDATCRG